VRPRGAATTQLQLPGTSCRRAPTRTRRRRRGMLRRCHARRPTNAPSNTAPSTPADSSSPRVGIRQAEAFTVPRAPGSVAIKRVGKRRGSERSHFRRPKAQLSTLEKLLRNGFGIPCHVFSSVQERSHRPTSRDRAAMGSAHSEARLFAAPIPRRRARSNSIAQGRRPTSESRNEGREHHARQ
jgi:hypothetical protein